MTTTTTKRPRYTFHEDPAHGWLAVPVAEVRRLGVKVSSYSYLSPDRKTVYLEEDCDATAFVMAARADAGITGPVTWGSADEPFDVWTVHHRDSAPCRSYRHWEAS